ncbi:hypothetical protein ARMGADRAFT_447517 [Armillaria gallica]|uniref:Uncharacterized protein n=1 Tax=Armillaria gallica TaxID=47427 RepID=A0A2H3D1K1_ARMGA|nr:hypothetical protein ARMGADRAFT_447517 [Armillaria gallica]
MSSGPSNAQSPCGPQNSLQLEGPGLTDAFGIEGTALLVDTITFYQRPTDPSDRSVNAQLLFTLPGNRIRSYTSLTDVHTIVTRGCLADLHSGTN